MFDLKVSYSQIAVFWPELANPFNDWSKQHFAQGFSWREGSVSFKTIIESGPMKLEALVTDQFEMRDDSIRAISVPFYRSSVDASVEIASIAESRVQDLHPGQYQLVCEMGALDGTHWCKLTFVIDGSLEPVIFKADNELTPQLPLLMEASSP